MAIIQVTFITLHVRKNYEIEEIKTDSRRDGRSISRHVRLNLAPPRELTLLIDNPDVYMTIIIVLKMYTNLIAIGYGKWV
jgi:hypothetical protein